MKKKRAKSLRSTLVHDVQKRLTEVFLAKGFAVVPLPPEEANSEMKTAFPLGRLKRKRGDELDVIEIQFDKYRRPQFVINFGVVPKGGVTSPWGHEDQDVAGVSGLSNAYRLYSSSFRLRWFQLGPLSLFRLRWFQLGLLSPKNEAAISRLVDKAIVLSSEINDWFESGTVGKHMNKAFGHFALPTSEGKNSGETS